MGYSTDFSGKFNITGDITVRFLRELEKANDGQPVESVIGIGREVVEAPDGYCQWELTDGYTSLQWDGGEKFYDYIKWLEWICAHFVKDGIKLNGSVQWQGEEIGDVGIIRVKDNNVITEKLKLEVGDDFYDWVAENYQDVVEEYHESKR